MDEKRLFSVLVRWLGLVIFLEGVRALALDVMIWTTPARFGNSPPLFGGQEQVYVVVIVLLGLTMIRFPEWVVHITWFEKSPSSS